jgi:hypothetical protein
MSWSIISDMGLGLCECAAGSIGGNIIGLVGTNGEGNIIMHCDKTIHTIIYNVSCASALYHNVMTKVQDSILSKIRCVEQDKKALNVSCF